ncbi:hypothetical protein ACXWRS_11145, partial [Streptococcus pyogenes]
VNLLLSLLLSLLGLFSFSRSPPSFSLLSSPPCLFPPPLFLFSFSPPSLLLPPPLLLPLPPLFSSPLSLSLPLSSSLPFFPPLS